MFVSYRERETTIKAECVSLNAMPIIIVEWRENRIEMYVSLSLSRSVFIVLFSMRLYYIFSV